MFTVPRVRQCFAVFASIFGTYLLRHSLFIAARDGSSTLRRSIRFCSAHVVHLATSASGKLTFPAIVARFGISVAPAVASPLALCRAELGDVANHVTNVALPRVRCHVWHPNTTPTGHVPSKVEPLYHRNMMSKLKMWLPCPVSRE